jgi:hypothetical protein
LNAALLFKPCTFAFFANESRPCRVFHLVDEDDDARRFWRYGAGTVGA